LSNRTNPKLRARLLTERGGCCQAPGCTLNNGAINPETGKKVVIYVAKHLTDAGAPEVYSLLCLGHFNGFKASEKKCFGKGPQPPKETLEEALDNALSDRFKGEDMEGSRDLDTLDNSDDFEIGTQSKVDEVIVGAAKSLIGKSLGVSKKDTPARTSKVKYSPGPRAHKPIAGLVNHEGIYYPENSMNLPASKRKTKADKDMKLVAPTLGFAKNVGPSYRVEITDRDAMDTFETIEFDTKREVSTFVKQALKDGKILVGVDAITPIPLTEFLKAI
jgi:hypothetical protein